MEISLFYICALNIMIRWCTFPEIWCVTDVIIFHFGLCLAILPPEQPKKSKFWKKWKKNKTPGDVIILHMCSKKSDQKMYGSWNMVCNRCNCYFSLWAIFCTFTPLTAQKVKISKKWKKKKHIEISSFYICVPKIMIRRCMVSEIWCLTDYFGPYFALLSS